MLNNLKGLLRQRLEKEPTNSLSAKELQLLPHNVTPLTPHPLPPKIGSMGDRAQAAFDELSSTLNDWFDADFQRLIDSWRRAEPSYKNNETRKELFHAAHNLAGMGETYGRPGIGRLCRSAHLLEHDTAPLSRELVSLHIDACRAARSNQQSDEDLSIVCEALESEVQRLRAA